MTQHHLARPRIFGALLESFERDEQGRHHPSPMSVAGEFVLLVLVLGPLMLLTLPLWLGAYYMLVVACICAFWWLDRGFVVRIGYGVGLLGHFRCRPTLTSSAIPKCTFRNRYGSNGLLCWPQRHLVS